MDKHEITRGEVAVRAGTLEATRRVDVRLTLVERLLKPLKTTARVLFHAGTAHVEASVVLLEADELWPGETAFAQLRLDEETVVLPGQGFILRGFEVQANYGKTLGGGHVVDPQPDRHRRKDAPTLARLARQADGSPDERVLALLEGADARGLTRLQLHARTNLPAGRLDKLLGKMMSDHRARRIEGDSGEVFFAEQAAEALANSVLQTVSAYHAANPSKPGIPKEELRSRLGLEDARLFGALLGRQISRGKMEEIEDLIRISGFTPKLTDEDKVVTAGLEDVLTRAGLEPPSLSDLASTLSVTPALVEEALGRLVREGKVVKLREGLFVETTALENLRVRLVAFLKERGEITTTELKDLVGSSRKYVIPLGEYFDRTKLTIRISDVKRRLRTGAA